MRLARKLQLAYLVLILIPPLVIGSFILVTFYTYSSTAGLFSELKAPGWIKLELSIIYDQDWERYDELKEKAVIFVMDEEGNILFPEFTAQGLIPESYPHFDAVTPVTPESGVTRRKALTYLPDIYAAQGTDWAMDISITPVVYKGVSHMAAWKEPRRGLPGFIARRGWMIPLFVLTGVMLIPAFIDARLRRSIRRLQAASLRLSTGALDEPIAVTPRDDLAELAASLESTRVELKDARDRKARFLMAVSHDLRTPLTSIKGYIEALEDGMAADPGEQARYLSVLKEKAGLLEGRIDELIDFARSDTGGWKNPGAVIPAADFFARLDAAFRNDSGFAGRDFSSEIEIPEGAFIDGDEKALYRAWENLFSNALRHTDNTRSIRFRVGAEEIGQTSDGADPRTFLFGEIADSGTGVDEDFIPVLFEPFARADKSRNREGLGLGLASVKAVAEAHGGEADYRPGDEGGSIFRIRIPYRLQG